ncbi:MAG: hypothetical protein JWM68_3538 [Verrucomicrobiales bacterium]|nr:hypothetical protein [Verrucomicrobiales bacterium]
MKSLLLVLLVWSLVSGCKQETFHDQVQKDLSDRVINTNQPELGTDPNIRLDTKQGPGEVTSGSSGNPRSAETLGGGSATGAGGAGPGYDGSKTNQPK